MVWRFSIEHISISILPYISTLKNSCGPLTALVNTTRGSRVGPAQSARENHPTRGKAPFLAWGDFHARTLFAPSTIPEEKWWLLEVWHELNYNIFVKLGRASTTIAFSSVSHVLFCDRKDSLEFQQIKTLLSIVSPQVRESGFRNLGKFCL